MVPLLRGGSENRGRSAPAAFSLRPAFPIVSAQSLLPAPQTSPKGPANQNNPQNTTGRKLRGEPFPITTGVAVTGTDPPIPPAPRDTGPRDARAEHGESHANGAQCGRDGGRLSP